MSELNQSMEEKYTLTWRLANHLTFIEAEGSNMPWASNEESGTIFDIIEVLPVTITHWMEGHMSLADLIAMSPDKVEAKLDRGMANILAIYKAHDFPIPEFKPAHVGDPL
jgi:hypothetical protein